MTARVETFLATAAWAALLLLFWSAAVWTPLHDWNGARFYPAYLLASGQPLYHVAGEGVVNGWIYGPLLPLLLAPCTWIADASWAMVAAGWCNLGFLFAPLLLVFNYALRDVPWRRRFLLSAAVVGAFLLVPTTNSRLVFITADQLAIGLGCLSCLLLHHARRSATRKPALWLAGAAALNVAACWTKQTEALLPLAQLAFLACRGERRPALRYAFALTAVHVAAGAAMAAWFGPRALWFNLAWIPSHHPLATGYGNLTQRSLALALYTTPLLAICFWLRRRAGTAPSTDPDRRGLAEQLIWAGVGLLPFGLMAAAKNGGDENSFHSLYYLALGAVILLVHRAAARPENWLARAGAGFAIASLAAGIWCVRGDVTPRLRPAPQLQRALEIARATPGRVVFPRNPLVTWLTERKQYHLEWGLYDQVVAGVPLRRENFWRGMPSSLSQAVYPLPGTYFFLQLFPPVIKQEQVFDFITVFTFAPSGSEVRP